MVDAFGNAVLPPLAASALLSFVVERMLRPDLGFGARSPAACAVHLGCWTINYGILLILLQRPWFAAAFSLSEILLIVLVSNAKFHSLREYFVFRDLDYLTDTIRHPRLYLPFLGVARLLGAIAAFSAAIWGVLTFEASLLSAVGSAAFWSGCAIVLAGGALLLSAGTWLGPDSAAQTFDPGLDMRKAGILATMWAYARAERRPLPLNPGAPSFAHANPSRGAAPGHIVVVQSESFFDPRRLHAGVRKDVLRAFDAIRGVACRSGRLTVPAWGANTVRTEFAFLTGLQESALGAHRFTPYRTLDPRKLDNIARFLKDAGYRTVCVHPYDAGFYDRERVMPAFGFDEFIDIRAFAGAKHDGPFVGDIAVAAKIRAILESAAGPTLVFAITMENHGPLHLETVAAADVEAVYDSAPPPGFDDLTVYLRHLANADRMIGMLGECLSAPRTRGWLCWYGDHVPIMPDVYRASGDPDGRTDYFICGPDAGGGAPPAQDIDVSGLARLLLQEAGLMERSA